MSKKKETRTSKNAAFSVKSAESGRFVNRHDAVKPKTTEHEIASFVKGFYEKNGKAMTQLAYE